MSKKIDEARKNLSKALKHHADAVGGSRVSLKHAERAGAKLVEAATAYADAVRAKSGIETAFTAVSPTKLDDATIHSLSAERDAISKGITGPVPIQKKPATKKAS